MSQPWLQENFKRSSRSRSVEKRSRVDEFGRSIRSRSRSHSRSSSRSRGKGRMDEGSRHSRDSSRSRSYKSRDRSRERGRKDFRDIKRRKKRNGSSSSSSDSNSSVGERLVASNKPKYLNARLFVANIVSKDISKEELTKHFEKYGNVVGEYSLNILHIVFFKF